MLRRAAVEDAGAIAALFRRSFGTLTFLPTLHTPDEDQAFFREVVQEHEVWVWDQHDRILGFAALGPDMLHHLYVEPDDHGRGIGSALLAHAKGQRPQGLRLWTFQQNAVARRFYEHRGFHVVELTDGSANEERMPDALYEWDPRAERGDALPDSESTV
jgi:putative acetyltransferase